ncbi:hypothetical protein ACIBF6_12855 [Streptosporangium amethystogenes]|uniref:hypothetical protein n=1 Tax=Streptosporangium amethystogenes TaxID=2002 RepID=UPI00360B48DE
MLIVAGIWWSGGMTPHIRWSIDDFFLSPEVDKNGVLYANVHIELENEGTSFTLTGISAEMPGLRLLPADKEREERSVVTVEGGGSEILIRRIVITDCAAVPHEPQPVRFTYRTWMGSGAAEATLDSWQLTGPAERLQIAWQRGIAGKVCNEVVSSKWF